MVNFKKIPVKKPIRDPMAAFKAWRFEVLLSSSPENAPIKGPITIPKGPIKIKPIIRPIVDPMIPFFDPPNFLVPKAGIM